MQLKIQMKKTSMTEVLDQIELLREDVKVRSSLRLLSEEMFSMMANVLDTKEATFEIVKKDGAYSLTIVAEADVSEQAREAYLSVSANGKNNAYSGIVGKLFAIADFIDGGSPVEPMSVSPEGVYWAMSEYIAKSSHEKDLDWDGMEKSIIANFADDVIVGVRNRKLEMTVIKKV